MKALWTIVCVVAVANVLALLGLVGWLRASDRLNWDRAREVRELFTRTLTQEREQAEQQAQEEAQAKARAEAEARAARMPLKAEEVLAARVELTELDRQRIQRLMREGENLRSAFAQERVELDRRWAALEERERALQTLTQQFTAQANDEQFQKTLGVLQAMRPAQAVQVMTEMLGQQEPSDAAPGAGFAPVGAPAARGTAQLPQGEAVAAARRAAQARRGVVVDYLNAMEDRARTRLLSEWSRRDPRLAAELLDDLRRRGQVASGAGAS